MRHAAAIRTRSQREPRCFHARSCQRVSARRSIFAICFACRRCYYATYFAAAFAASAIIFRAASDDALPFSLLSALLPRDIIFSASHIERHVYTAAAMRKHMLAIDMPCFPPSYSR